MSITSIQYGTTLLVWQLNANKSFKPVYMSVQFNHRESECRTVPYKHNRQRFHELIDPEIVIVDAHICRSYSRYYSPSRIHTSYIIYTV